ncbi:hypothetical protein E5676_scaffold11G00640 [Cucumis melo var. makuwa]|uniref:Uncharacterized protein n=1 Tax=Cucumis melo var. makuwa TaxID=1194695 RepID=A0A5D3BWF8_CUCMM|nr:hypothetical protein E5676_scaffold11G00640 [Cucumis melo var. makuwa]
MLEKSGFRISSVGQRKNDYAGALDFFDLWVIDEFMEDNLQNLYEIEQRNAYMKAILTLLDGQESRLDGKYERRFLKKENVPIILMIPSAFTNLSTPWWTDYECILRNPNLKDSSLKGVEIRVSDPEGNIYSLFEIEGGKESLLLNSRGRISHEVKKERIKEEKEEKTREEWGVQRQGRKSKPILRSLRELRKKGQTPSMRLGRVL